MPAGDNLGPRGKGPMTGRGLGLCAGNDTPGSATEIIQQGENMRGMGRGKGRGLGRVNRRGQARGWGFRFSLRDASPDQDASTEELKSNKVKRRKKAK